MKLGFDTIKFWDTGENIDSLNVPIIVLDDADAWGNIARIIGSGRWKATYVIIPAQSHLTLCYNYLVAHSCAHFVDESAINYFVKTRNCLNIIYCQLHISTIRGQTKSTGSNWKHGV